VAAHLVTGAVIFAAGIGGLLIVQRATPERAVRLRHLGRLASLIWYLPFPLARLVYALMSLALCGLAVAVLLGHVL
jgi:hypothetical protein